MKFFWPVYLSSVIVGTVGVYVAAPLARPCVAGLRKAASPEQTPATVADMSGSGATAASAPVPGAPPPQLSGAEPAHSVAAPARPQDDDDVPPAVSGIYLASYGDRPEWGVTSQRTAYYKPDGTRIGNVPGGLLFDVCTTHRSSKGVMVECRFAEGGLTNGVYLVGRKNVCLFTASYAKLSPRQREALKAYYALNGKVESRKTELLQASAAKNPFLASANTAYTAFNAHVEKAQALTLQRDRATGLERSRAEDQLREMKVKEVQLKIALDSANQKFREWKQQHGGETAKPENDADIKKWQQEMADLRQRVPGLAI